MAQSQPQFDFLRVFIEQLLDENGFEEVSEETRAQYVPLFIAEGEKRLGFALTPMLSDAALTELAALAEKGEATPEALQNFWRKNVPNFEREVQKVLTAFGQEVKNTLATIKK